MDLKKDAHELDGEAQAQLGVLKQRLCDRLGAKRINTYSTYWEGNGVNTAHVRRLCVDVYRLLRRCIYAEIKRHRTRPSFEEEQIRHQEFAQRRARDFTGQCAPLAEIDRYLSSTTASAAPLVIYGISGSGKSALLAKAVADDQSRNTHHQPVFRFIGATANSTDLHALLEGFCRELGEHYTVDNTDLPLELDKLMVVFRQRLELATADRPLVLFIDALDQLQYADHQELSWLPDRLPAHVRLVVSATPGLMLDSLRAHLPSAQLLELTPMCPEDAAELLEKWLHRARRRLIPAEHLETMRAGCMRCSWPLYLRLVFEEAQRWRSYDHPPRLSPDVDGMIKRLFSHLEPSSCIMIRCSSSALSATSAAAGMA